MGENDACIPFRPTARLEKRFQTMKHFHMSVICSPPWAPIAAPKGLAGHKDPTARAKDKEQRPSHSESDSVVSHKGRAGHKDRVAAATRSLWPARPLGSPRVLATTGPNFKVLLMELGCNRVQPSSISSTLKKWEYGYHGSWYLVLRVLEARDFASARLLHLRPHGHPEASDTLRPHVAISTK